jgi:hypothetical protein
MGEKEGSLPLPHTDDTISSLVSTVQTTPTQVADQCGSADAQPPLSGRWHIAVKQHTPLLSGGAKLRATQSGLC